MRTGFVQTEGLTNFVCEDAGHGDYMRVPAAACFMGMDWRCKECLAAGRARELIDDDFERYMGKEWWPNDA